MGGIEKMKNYLSVFSIALAATAVWLGVPSSTASAQNTSTISSSATTPPAGSLTQGPALPYGAGEVVKMYQAGINKDIIVSYINSTALPYHLSADGIIYLQGLGMPQEVTQSMIQRDGQLQQQAMQQYFYQQQLAASTATANDLAARSPAQVVTPTTPAPSVTVIGGSDYPYNYDYGYPYYAGYGWPYFGGYGGGLGWGWGNRMGWGRGGNGGFRGGGGGFRGGIGGFHGGGGGVRGGVGFGGLHGGGGSHGGFGGGHGGGGGHGAGGHR
jgi:hypothetical protein